MSDLKTVQARCLLAQQRLPEVRQPLSEALSIRKIAAITSSPDSLKRLIRAQLNIGQFDRDQSNFADADSELKEALRLTKTHFSANKALLAECFNSYADCRRQMGYRTSGNRCWPNLKLSCPPAFLSTHRTSMTMDRTCSSDRFQFRGFHAKRSGCLPDSAADLEVPLIDLQAAVYLWHRFRMPGNRHKW